MKSHADSTAGKTKKNPFAKSMVTGHSSFCFAFLFSYSCSLLLPTPLSPRSPKLWPAARFPRPTPPPLSPPPQTSQPTVLSPVLLILSPHQQSPQPKPKLKLQPQPKPKSQPQPQPNPKAQPQFLPPPARPRTPMALPTEPHQHRHTGSPPCRVLGARMALHAPVAKLLRRWKPRPRCRS